MRGSNAGGAAPAGLVVTSAEVEMGAFDALPDAIRHWLREAPLSFNAAEAQLGVRLLGERETLRRLNAQWGPGGAHWRASVAATWPGRHPSLGA